MVEQPLAADHDLDATVSAMDGTGPVISFSPENVEESGEVESRIFAIYMDAAMPALKALAKRHGLSNDQTVSAFVQYRQGEITGSIADAVAEMCDGFRSRDRDSDEPWKRTDND